MKGVTKAIVETARLIVNIIIVNKTKDLNISFLLLLILFIVFIAEFYYESTILL